MSQRLNHVRAFWLVTGLLGAMSLHARADETVIFSTNPPDGKMAAASRPGTTAQIEIEAGDDFILATEQRITSMTFTGLLGGGATTHDIAQVVVEIYRVFPKDSDANRTPKVPTRTNSPSDVALQSRDSASNELTYTVEDLGAYTAANSVLNGIHPSPNQTTGGEGAVSGREVQFTVRLATAFDLPADHYFFVPQVRVSAGEFYWLSAPKPIVTPGTPLATDLQAWIRNADLDPDWLRIGTDIVGGTTPPTFNMTFSLSAEAPPETQPATETPPSSGTETPPSGDVTPAAAPASTGGTRGICGLGAPAMISLTLFGLVLMRLGGVGHRRSRT